MQIKKKSLSCAVLISAIGFSSCSALEKQDERKITFTKIENNYQELIKEIKTPKEASDYCIKELLYQEDFNNYLKDDYWASFKVINERKRDDCDGGAIAAAALLSDNGYPATILNSYVPDSYSHSVFLYKENEKYGSIGINSKDYQEATYDNIGDLVKALNESLGKKFCGYFVIDFSDSYDTIINSDEDFSDLYIEKMRQAKRYDLGNKEIKK